MQTQYFERAEGGLAYSDYGGDGQLVLMLPGMGALRSEYRFLAPELKKAGYRPVTVDLRGHGESSVPWMSYDVPAIGGDILALIEHLGADGAHVIGTSKASAATVWAAAERPERVRSITLIGPFAYEVKINPIMQAIFWLMMHNPWSVRVWTSYYSTLYPTRKPADFKEYLAQLEQSLRQPRRFKATVAVGDASLKPSGERLQRVKAPTLVIMGTRDPDFSDPRAVGQYLADQTGGKLELVDGAGHYPQTEMPEITSPIILDFLRRSG